MYSDNEMLRSLVREALRDALGGASGASDIAKALSGSATPVQKPAQVVEMVSVATDAEVSSFVHRILDLAADTKTLSALRSGELVFQLTESSKASTAAAADTTRIDKGAVTESTIRKAAESGSTLIVGRKVVVTSLARDKARDLGVTIVRESQQDNPKVREFSGGLKAVQTKKGPLLLVEADKKENTVFLGWPNNVSFDDMTEEIAIAFKREQDEKKENCELGEWNDQPILKKSGKFGTYLQCGELSIPYQENEELEKMIERFEAKQKQKSDGNGVIQKFKEYIIRTGQYGPYIIKTSVKKVQFVSVPKGLDATKITEKEVEGIYRAGLETKKNFKSYKK
jgi:topoisomerase IA-like protein